MIKLTYRHVTTLAQDRPSALTARSSVWSNPRAASMIVVYGKSLAILGFRLSAASAAASLRGEHLFVLDERHAVHVSEYIILAAPVAATIEAIGLVRVLAEVGWVLVFDAGATAPEVALPPLNPGLTHHFHHSVLPPFWVDAMDK